METKLESALAAINTQLSTFTFQSGMGESSVLGSAPGSTKSGSPFAHTPLPKLDFPSFDGRNPRSWILKWHSYFKLMPHVPDVQKVHMAAMYFEGRALSWFQNLQLDGILLTWAQVMSPGGEGEAKGSVSVDEGEAKGSLRGSEGIAKGSVSVDEGEAKGSVSEGTKRGD